MDPKLENFERAFRNGTGGCVRTCHCGHVYFHDTDHGYDWEDGELEKLRANTKAHGLEYSPSDISFEGDEYVDACTCWHERAKKIMAWINSHGHKIAEFLTLEKRRKQTEADHSPVVK